MDRIFRVWRRNRCYLFLIELDIEAISLHPLNHVMLCYVMLPLSLTTSLLLLLIINRSRTDTSQGGYYTLLSHFQFLFNRQFFFQFWQDPQKWTFANCWIKIRERSFHAHHGTFRDKIRCIYWSDHEWLKWYDATSITVITESQLLNYTVTNTKITN